MSGISRRNEALKYRNTRHWSVMPVSRTGNKKPCVKWKPYQYKLPTPAEIARWFDEQFPDANVGLITGEYSGCFVVDADSEEALQWLLSHELPDCPIAESSQAYKQHFYFKHPGFQVANSQSKIRMNIDVRGDGGYAVLPPSVHHSGVQYKWLVSPFDCELPNAPGWLLDLIIKKSEPKPDIPPPVPIRPNDPNASRLQRYALGALNSEAQLIATAPDGTKHAAVRDGAIKVATLAAHGIITTREIEDHLYAAIAPRAKDKSQALQTIRDGISYGIKFPRDLKEIINSCTRQDLYNNGTYQRTHATAMNGSHANGSHANGYQNGHTTGISYSQAIALEYEANDCPVETMPPQELLEEPPAPLYETYTFRDLEKMPRPEWLIRSMLIERGSSVLSADSGSFKSFIALAMGLCIATGREFVGNEVKQGAVVFVAAEGFYTLRDRAEAWSIYNECPLPENFHILKVPVNLADPITAANFTEYVASLSPAFIVLDTLSQNAIGLNENDNNQMADFMRGMIKLADNIGAHVQVLHHNAKATGMYRGAGSIKANVDSHIALEKSEGDFENYVIVKCEKQRGRPFKDFALQGEEIALTYCDEYGEPVTSLVFDLADVQICSDGNSHKDRDSKVAQRYKERLMEVFDHCAIDAEQRYGSGGVTVGHWLNTACPEDQPSMQVCNKTTFFKYRKLLESEGVIEEYDYAGKSPLFRRKEQVRQGSPEFARTETNQSDAVGSAKYQHPPKGGLNYANQHQRTDMNSEPNTRQNETEEF